jgi:hypothetical protein
MRDMKMLFELFVATMAHDLKTLDLKPFVVIWVSTSIFLTLCRLSEWCG